MPNDRPIDINADLGESFGVYQYGADEAVLPLITSANIAAGFHASDPITLQQTVAKAMANGVRLGAHVGYPDRLGFGRRSIGITAEEAYAYTLYQLGAVEAFVRAQGGKLTHVKPHGALYMDACSSKPLADGIVRAIFDFDPTLLIYTIPYSCVEQAAAAAGINVWREFFADRPYGPNGVQMFGWTLDDIGRPTDAASRTLDQLKQPNGFDTVCVHSDTPGAPEILYAVREAISTRYPLVKPGTSTNTDTGENHV